MHDLFDEGINTLYMPSRIVPKAHEYGAAWAQQSAAVREQFTPTEWPYGAGPHERVDLFEPSASARATMLFIHGGYWKAFYKDHFSYVAPPLLQASVRVAVMSYDLIPGATLRQIVPESPHA